jgi:hypothetical protein
MVAVGAEAHLPWSPVATAETFGGGSVDIVTILLVVFLILGIIYFVRRT